MSSPTMIPRVTELIAETRASLMRLHTLFDQLREYCGPVDRGRSVRMSPPEVRRILARGRILAKGASNTEAVVNARAEMVEIQLELGPWLRAARARAETLRLEFETVRQAATNLYAGPFHELKRISRQPGYEALAPNVHDMDVALRKLQRAGRGRETRRAKRRDAVRLSRRKR